MRLIRTPTLVAICGALAVAVLASTPCSAGSIGGRVFDRVSGEPLAGVTVELGEAVNRTTTTAADGSYRFEGLSGSYYVWVPGPSLMHVGQLYPEEVCSFPYVFAGCRTTAGTSVTVTADGAIEGIDFPLDRAGELTGTVTDAAHGTPLVAEVELLWSRNPDAERWWLVRGQTTEADGRFHFPALPAGRYLLFVAAEGYTRQAYGGVVCDPVCGFGDVTQIAVEHGAVTRGIDTALVRHGSIEGTARGDDSSTIFSLNVWLYDTHGALREIDIVDGDAFSFERLPAGDYFLRTRGFDTWIDEIYDGLTCPQPDGSCEVTAGTPVTVAPGAVTGDVDFTLRRGGQIHGSVYARDTGEPVGGYALVYSDSGVLIRSVEVEEQDGRYELSGLAPGRYVVAAVGGGYLPALAPNIPCPGLVLALCDLEAAEVVVIDTAGDVVTDVDIELFSGGPCMPSDQRLCLRDGRFAVDLDWRRASSTGRGRAGPLDFSDDTGYFWFFDPDNVEVAVKVLDACSTPRRTFWVFAAGLTNLETTMVVTDLWTGQQQRYTSTLGTPFAPVLDTAAFDTCTALPPSSSALVSAGEAGAGDGPGSSSWRDARPRAVGEASAPSAMEGPSPCGLDPSEVCLRDRFRLRATWEKPDGTRGEATPVRLTDATGMMWFFGPNNVELVVKVLSNCGGPTDRYWVFAAGLTNLGVTLTITDTLHGDVRTYVSTPGMPYPPILDTAAFDTCP